MVLHYIPETFELKDATYHHQNIESTYFLYYDFINDRRSLQQYYKTTWNNESNTHQVLLTTIHKPIVKVGKHAEGLSVKVMMQQVFEQDYEDAPFFGYVEVSLEPTKEETIQVQEECHTSFVEPDISAVVQEPSTNPLDKTSVSPTTTVEVDNSGFFSEDIQEPTTSCTSVPKEFNTSSPIELSKPQLIALIIQRYKSLQQQQQQPLLFSQYTSQLRPNTGNNEFFSLSHYNPIDRRYEDIKGYTHAFTPHAQLNDSRFLTAREQCSQEVPKWPDSLQSLLVT